MTKSVARKGNFWLSIVLLQLALAAAIVLVGAWNDRQTRTQGPEAPVLAYAAALRQSDLAGSLEQLAPTVREGSTEFVQWQLGNRYTILESAVRTAVPLDLMGGDQGDRARVVVVLDIQEEGGAQWRATEEIPVALIDNRWYLLKPPLKPGA